MAKLGKVLPCGRRNDAGNGYAIPKNREQLAARLLRSLADYVAGKGLRQSESRTQIVGILGRLSRHFSASELIEKVRARYPDIGAATIYRNLQTFIDAGVLRETLTLDNGERIFEVESGGHHDHIVCLDCRAIFEFQSRVIEKEQDSITKSQNFFSEGHRHVIYARCGYLKKRHRKRKAQRIEEETA